MKLGDKVYRIAGNEIYEFEIVLIELTYVTLKNINLNTTKRMRQAYFEEWYTYSKVILIRSLLYEIDNIRDRLIEELGEYELKCLTGEIIPKEPLKT